MNASRNWIPYIVFGLLLAVPFPAVASPYWVAYEGDGLPESQGWARHYGNELGPEVGGAERSVDDGILTVDSLRHPWIYDFAERTLPADPQVGETFVAEWRLSVDPRSDTGDVGVTIAPHDSPAHLSIRYGPTGLILRPGNVVIDIAPGTFHQFRVESQDMQSYRLHIDDMLRYTGVFETYTLLQSFVNFGDCVQGYRSCSQWDYFRYGVIPEPSTFLLLLAAFCLLLVQRRAARGIHERRQLPT